MALNNSQHTSPPLNYSVQAAGHNTTSAVLLSAGSIVITTATLFLNAGVLLILLKVKSLQTPFNVYIIVLLFSNVFYVGTQAPVSIITAQIGPGWIGFNTCTLSIFCLHVVSAITVHTHVLISINRAWALFWPVSYKHHHTARMAWLLCVSMIAYLHLVLLPGIILDAIHYRVPSRFGCFLNADKQLEWYMFVSVWVFDVAKLFTPVFYPVLLWKYLWGRRTRYASRTVNSKSGTSHTKSEPAARPSRKISRSFILLTLFTIGAAVCWIPGAVYYTLVTYIPESELAGLSVAKSALYPLLALVDPVFFYITNLHGYILSRLRNVLITTKKKRVGNEQPTGR